MWISIKNPDQVIWLAGNLNWVWHLNLFSMRRVKTVVSFYQLPLYILIFLVYSIFYLKNSQIYSSPLVHCIIRYFCLCTTHKLRHPLNVFIFISCSKEVIYFFFPSNLGQNKTYMWFCCPSLSWSLVKLASTLVVTASGGQPVLAWTAWPPTWTRKTDFIDICNT